MSDEHVELQGELPIAGPPPTQQVNCYRMIDSKTRGEWVGGSYDSISAVTIACAWFQARVSMSSFSSDLCIGVFDANLNVLAFIGQPASSTPPAQQTPATCSITKLNPNTSVASQMVSVIIDGSGFINGAQIEVVGKGAGQNASWISANQIQTNYLFPATPGAYQVGVRNPGEALSNTLPFTVT